MRQDPRRPGLATARFAPARRPRWGTLALVLALHIAALLGLVQVFAPNFTATVIEQAESLVTVTVTAPPDPPPSPDPPPRPDPSPDAGAAADPAPRATPRATVAPRAPLPRQSPAPRVASTGSAASSGAGDQGQGTGAGGEGAGTGSGASGSGQGNGARPLELLSGRIDNARDYPRDGREARRGQDVVIELTVGTDGRVSACRVTDASPDPAADAITCRLATQRFVFRPRLNAAGEPVTGIFRWRQRWF